MPQPITKIDSASVAHESAVLLAALSAAGQGHPKKRFEIVGEKGPLPVPEAAAQLFTEILAQLAAGRVVRVIGVDAEVTTQEAADLLNVSRPHLVQLLEQGALPHRKVGSHRRVRYQDVLDFKARIDEERRKVLDELTAQAQELGMGYE